MFLPKELTDEWDALLFDPQTSGGLLFPAPPRELETLIQELDAHQVAHWQIGDVVAGFGVEVI